MAEQLPGPLGHLISLLWIDFSVWDHVTSLVYATPVSTQDELLPRIQAQVRDTSHVFERGHQSLSNRCLLGDGCDGKHEEQFLMLLYESFYNYTEVCL